MTSADTTRGAVRRDGGAVPEGGGEPRSAALERALGAVGGATKLAQILGISYQAVCQWRRLPASRVLEVECLTGVSRHELRPDLYPPGSRTIEPDQRIARLLAAVQGRPTGSAHPDSALLAQRLALLSAHAEHADARAVSKSMELGTPEYEAETRVARRLWSLISDTFAMAPPKTTEGLAVIGLALALHTEGAVCGVDEGDDEFVPVSAARAILSVTGASPPPGFMGYGDEPDFRERERAALHDRAGRIPDWAWGDEANARVGGDAGSDAAGPSQQAAGTAQPSAEPALFDQIVSAWREWAALPDLDETEVGQAEFDRHCDRRFALIRAAEVLPATIESLSVKGLALAWLAYAELWSHGKSRPAYATDGKLVLDIDTAICGRLKTHYARAEA